MLPRRPPERRVQDPEPFESLTIEHNLLGASRAVAGRRAAHRDGATCGQGRRPLRSEVDARLKLPEITPKIYQRMGALEAEVRRSGLDPTLYELVKI